MDGFREWLSGLSRREIAVMAVVGLVGVGGVGLWYARTRSNPVEVRTGSPVAAPSATPSPRPVVVHVAGWVHRPGVYEMREGDRVIDAIHAAGGPRKGADLGALNLAALLVDAQQVLVPRIAEGPSGQVSGPAEESPTGTIPQLVNVNTATAEDLETLPGIGEVLAAAIVAYREEHGPFTSVDQLEDVSGIGPVTLEELRDLITV